MKLYEMDLVGHCRRVRIFLAEKGIDVPGIQVDLLAGENLTAKHRAINPSGVLPLLELDDGTRIGESASIWRYFEEIQPEPRLMGESPVDKAVIDMWSRRADDGMVAVGEYFRNRTPAFATRGLPGQDDVAQIEALVERGRKRVARFYHVFDERLRGTDYLVGPRFTTADIAVMCVTDYAIFSGLEIPQDCPNLRRWYETVMARPSARAWPSMKDVYAKDVAAKATA